MWATDERWEGFWLQFKWVFRWICIFDSDFYIKVWLSSVLPCIRVAYVCTGLVYIICVCACACVYQSDSLPTQQQRGVTEGLPLRWQTVWSSKICLFSLTGCQSASVFFPPLHSPCLHPSLSLFLHHFSMKWEGVGSCQHEELWHYCQRELSIVAVYQDGPLLSDCHRGAGMRCENFARFVEGEIKHGTPTDLTPLSSWYQSLRT